LLPAHSIDDFGRRYGFPPGLSEYLHGSLGFDYRTFLRLNKQTFPSNPPDFVKYQHGVPLERDLDWYLTQQRDHEPAAVTPGWSPKVTLDEFLTVYGLPTTLIKKLGNLPMDLVLSEPGWCTEIKKSLFDSPAQQAQFEYAARKEREFQNLWDDLHMAPSNAVPGASSRAVAAAEAPPPLPTRPSPSSY
jgi:hypothetical protein